MQAPHLFEINDQKLWLSADRSAYWEAQETLIVSDLHFGKTGHFRKSGIGVPQAVFKEDLQRLLSLLQHFQPKQLVIVGDLFHSHENKEMALFQKWRENFPGIAFHLVKGNHDILPNEWYDQSGIELHEETMQVDRFCFIHDITTASGNSLPKAGYFFSGHIHPGVRVNGLAKQSLRFPCFYFGEKYAVLPAFSRFTGAALIELKSKDQVFAIVENKIIRMQ